MVAEDSVTPSYCFTVSPFYLFTFIRSSWYMETLSGLSRNAGYLRG